MNKLEVIVKEQGLNGAKAKELLDAFGAPFEEAGHILSTYQTIVVTDANDADGMAQARENRLALKRVRTGVENTRKDLKSDFIKAGRVIDAVASYVKDTIKPAEDYLQLQEDFALIQAQREREQLIAARSEQVQAADGNPNMYKLADMDEESFTLLIGELEISKARKIREERERIEAAEAQRQAEIKAQEAIAAENARLKAEAAEREKLQAKLDEQKRQRIGQVTNIGMRRQLDGIWSQPGIADTFTDLEVETLPFDILTARCNAITNIVYERNIKAEAERKAEKARLAQLEAERKQREADEAKRLKDIEDAEIKAKADALFAEQQAQTAPDKEKLLTFVRNLSDWQNSNQVEPVGEAAKLALEKANTHLLKVIDFLDAEAKKL